MGNACCSENGGQSHDDEMKNYDSRHQGRPVNQSADGKMNFTHLPDQNYPQNSLDDNLLLAYTSGDQKKIVKIQSHFRGHNTRKRLKEGNQIIISQLEQYKTGHLYNVVNMRVDDQSDDSAIYTGQMLKDSQNIKQGYGIMKWPDGTVYEGLWENNLYNGRGKLYHASGDLYEGEFVDDMAQGFGIYRHANGSKYVGYWNQDKQHGFGKEKWNDGSQYVGFYQDASKEGQGEYRWPDGNRYIGEWRNNMLNGQGLFMWHDDRLYLGDWNDNMMHGQGTYRWGDGRMFIGQYVDDRKSGIGIYLWADGRAYHGEWLQGKQHGEGFYIVPDPQNSHQLKIKKGKWQLGKRQEWLEEINEEESNLMRAKYQEINVRKEEIKKDIETIELTIQRLVQQQLGDKSGYDSTLNDLDSPGQTGKDHAVGQSGDQPLEKMIKDALNYDSTLYKQALGIDNRH